MGGGWGNKINKVINIREQGGGKKKGIK